MTKYYELEQHNLWHIKNNNDGKCSRCGVAFKIGDTVIRMGRAKKDQGRYLHKKCFHSLFIEV